MKMPGLWLAPCVMWMGCTPGAPQDISPRDGQMTGLPDCQSLAFFGWINAPDTDEQALQEAGIHTRAARSILAWRLGPDGRASTGDDQVVENLEQLDDLDQVGPKAMTALRAYGFRACVQADVVFSPRDYADSHLARTIDTLDAAQHTIDVAMYSFRDGGVFDALTRAVNRGVSVRLMTHSASEHRKDPEGTRSATLEDEGIEVRWINKIMHHKFAIVDGPRTDPARADSAVVTNGSGNWSYSAGTRFDENTVFVQGDRRLTLQLQDEFNLLWNNSRDLVWNESIASAEHTPIESDWIDTSHGAETRFTSANFESYESARYGATFTRIDNESAVQDALVEFIDSAKNSIDIASGHLRSQAITEALLKKRQTDPGVRIRVYLDGQEYTSQSYFEEERAEIDTCLSLAGFDNDAISECREKGAHFGYALHEAGIDSKYKYYSYRWHYYSALQMHHKYVIVDETNVASGSYNLSPNAEWNTMENLVFYDALHYPELIEAFTENFESIWYTGEHLYTDLLDEIRSPAISEFPIMFEPMALDWQEVSDLKAAIEENCPALFSDEYLEEPWEHESCSRN